MCNWRTIGKLRGINVNPPERDVFTMEWKMFPLCAAETKKQAPFKESWSNVQYITGVLGYI